MKGKIVNEITPGEPEYAWKCAVCSRDSLMMTFATEEEAEEALTEHLLEHHSGKIAEVPSNWCRCCFPTPDWVDIDK